MISSIVIKRLPQTRIDRHFVISRRYTRFKINCAASPAPDKGQMQDQDELVIVALGGNALLQRNQPLTANNQRQNAVKAANSIADLSRKVPNILVVHGNGPQVGMLAVSDPDNTLDVLDAESEGQIGFLLETALSNALHSERETVALLTQVEVNSQDPAFKSPSKPIGRWYDDDSVGKAKGWTMKQDGDKYRRVVPSPQPKQVMESNAIRMLVEKGVIVICCGGGGIPIEIDENGQRHGVECVIDKDAAAALIGSTLEASWLLILTDESAVYNPEKWPEEKELLPSPITVSEIEQYSFAAGSMGPKISAACRFVRATGGRAGIGSMENALDILNGVAGTIITSG